MRCLRTLLRSSACFLLVSSLGGCPSPEPQKLEFDPHTEPKAEAEWKDKVIPIASTRFGDSGGAVEEGSAPHPSIHCMSWVADADGNCLEPEEVKDALDEASDAAVQSLSDADDPQKLLKAQENLAKIQEQRVEQAVKDTEEIKEMLEERQSLRANLPEDSEALEGPEDPSEPI